MTALAFGIRDAFRALRRDAGYSLVVTLTLALTVGATTAVFSIVNGVLLKPLAYREPQQLVQLREAWRQLPDIPSLEVNEQHFEYWRRHARSFASMAQFIPLPANLTGRGDAAQITAVHASASIFDVLGVQPVIGRGLNSDDERSGQPAVAVLTDGFWRRTFDADRSVIGRSIALDGRPYTVAGVLPPDFKLPYGNRLIANVDLFVPIRLDDDQVGWVGDHNNAAIGRLRPGVTLDRARAELDVLQRQVSQLAAQEAHEPVTLTSVLTPLAESIVGGARRGVVLLFAAIAAVLLIGCSNLANLSLTRTTGRGRDLAIRSALGAARSRLVTHAVIEPLLLASAGGALAVGVASAAIAVFVETAPVDLPRVSDVTLDTRVLAFTAVASIVAGLLVAVVPAWRIARGEMQTPLRSGGAGSTADRHGMRMRGLLLALQVAMSVTLLIVTGLLSASLLRLVHVDKGFTADGVLAVGVVLPAAPYAAETPRLAVYDRLIAGVEVLPGISGVTTTSMLPLAGGGQVNTIAPEGDTRPGAERPTANFRFIAPDFFHTLDVKIIRGRSFTDRERAVDRPAPALVSAHTARLLWPGQDAIGKRFSRGIAGEQGFEVVGVTADARTTSLATLPPPMVYVPYWWRTRAATSLLIRTSGDPASLMPAIRRVVRAIDPDIAVGDARPLPAIVESSLAARRYQMRLFVAFGLAAMAIAIIGVYGVTSYHVARRRREMNLRVALGAETSQVLALVVRQGVMPVLAGLGAGVIGAIALGGVLAGVLFEVPARDPRIIGLAAAVVGAAGVATAFLAARRGLTIDPASALRDE